MANAIASTNKEEVLVTPKWTTQSGDPATIQPGTLEVSVSSGNATVSIDPTNPESFIARSADNDEGVTMIEGAGDADRGEGIKRITFQLPYTVTAEMAAGVADFDVSVRPKSPQP